MDADNFQLDDLVYDKYHKRCDRITEMRFDSLRIENRFGVLSWFDVEPILLTVDILKKNGFECIKSKEGIEPRRKDFRMDNCWYGDGFRWNGIAVVYVHQLQHILKMCGLKDLSDNFKI